MFLSGRLKSSLEKLDALPEDNFSEPTRLRPASPSRFQAMHCRSRLRPANPPVQRTTKFPFPGQSLAQVPRSCPGRYLGEDLIQSLAQGRHCSIHVVELIQAEQADPKALEVRRLIAP